MEVVNKMVVGSVLVFAILLWFLTLLFIIKPIPIIAVPFGLMVWYITIMELRHITTLPVQPYFSFLLLMFSAISVFVNGQSYGETRGNKN